MAVAVTTLSTHVIASPSDPLPPQGTDAPRAVRLRARLRQHVLDREIAAGFARDSDPARALRAEQLIGATERRCVAASLANIVEAADERHADPASPLKLNHAEVLAARHEIAALIEILRSEREVTARGVALAGRLAEAHDSPLLHVQPGRTVQQAVSQALAAL